MNAGSHPVAIYSGEYTEVVFLKSLLEGSGIGATLVHLSVGEGIAEWRVQVAQSDVEAALPLVEHFREHGTKTDPW
jgi:hypothetical protein